MLDWDAAVGQRHRCRVVFCCSTDSTSRCDSCWTKYDSVAHFQSADYHLLHRPDVNQSDELKLEKDHVCFGKSWSSCKLVISCFDGNFCAVVCVAKKKDIFIFEINAFRFMCNGVADILPFLVYCRKQKKNLVSRYIYIYLAKMRHVFKKELFLVIVSKANSSLHDLCQKLHEFFNNFSGTVLNLIAVVFPCFNCMICGVCQCFKCLLLVITTRFRLVFILPLHCCSHALNPDLAPGQTQMRLNGVCCGFRL